MSALMMRKSFHKSCPFHFLNILRAGPFLSIPMPSPGPCHLPVPLGEASLLTGLPASTASTHSSQEGFLKKCKSDHAVPQLKSLSVPVAPGLSPSPFSQPTKPFRLSFLPTQPLSPGLCSFRPCSCCSLAWHTPPSPLPGELLCIPEASSRTPSLILQSFSQCGPFQARLLLGLPSPPQTTSRDCAWVSSLQCLQCHLVADT